MRDFKFASIEEALADLRQGRMIILVDDESRENEGDLVVAAEKITSANVNFMIKHARGLVCLALRNEDLNRLNIPMMVRKNTSKFQTAFTVSIGAAHGITTGISAEDRAHTIRVVVDEKSTPNDFVMPGHVFPLRACPGGVLTRPGHTEGSTDLMELAGLKPAAAICEMLKDDGTMARLPELINFGLEHQIKIVSIADLIVHRMQTEGLVAHVAEADLPIPEFGRFKIHTFESEIDKKQHVALVKGTINPNKTILVRIHSECLTGDIFGSSRCDCGNQLKLALAKISQEEGILLYMRQEGRGVGLGNKILAYALQDKGLDTVEANHNLGFAADERDYGVAAQILKLLGVQKMKLLTNNPSKIAGINRYGLEVISREPLEVPPTPDNITYLKTKREKLGHLFSFDEDNIHEDHCG